MTPVTALSAAGLLLLSQAALAGVDLQAATTHETNSAPLAVALADIDGDGIADVISGASGVRIHFSASTTTRDYLPDSVFSAVAIDDLDGNDVPDVVGLHYSVDAVAVLLLEANGEEAGHHELETGRSPSAIALGHLNADAYPDVVVANADDDTLSVFFSNGAGTFDAAESFDVGNYPAALAISDFNGDGHHDVYVLNMMSSTISPLLGDGNGGLAPQADYAVQKDASYIDDTSFPAVMAAGDVNGDGVPDLVTGSLLGNAVRTHVNDGDGVFSEGEVVSTNWHQPNLAVSSDKAFSDAGADIDVLVSAGSQVIAAYPRALDVADIDADGDMDLIAAAVNRSAVTVFPGTSGGYGAGVNFTLDSAAWSLAIGDAAGGDGRADVAIAIPGEARVAVMENVASAGWPPAAVSRSIDVEECSSTDAELLGEDADGESLTFEILAIEYAGTASTGSPGTSGTLTVGDTGDPPDVVVIGDVAAPRVVVRDLDTLSGTFTFTAADTDERPVDTWNIRFRVTDAGGASSEGDVTVRVSGDGDATCPSGIEIPVIGDGEIIFTPGEVESPGDGEDDEGRDDLAGSAPPAGEGVDDETESGGGVLNVFFLLLLAALRRRARA